mmetsp:Transcript_34039/g.80756  ORF Transcript_34039/g.80756 Transcript_34039/m.80756 type:complete len:198 (+) Transcript_34039:106-699(+)
MEVMMHAETGATRDVCGDYEGKSCSGSSENSSGRDSPMRRFSKEGSLPKGPIYLHLHENALARLGVGAAAVLSGAVTPRVGRSSCASKLPADACMVMPEQEPAVEHVQDERVEEEPLDLLAATLDLSQQLRLSCARAIRHGEIREQTLYEKTNESKELAFEDHLFLAEPTRRSRMTRNNACLDLGALSQRAAPCRLG